MASLNANSVRSNDRLHTKTVSTLTQRFPINRSKREIRTLVGSEIPAIISSGLLIRGNTTTTRSMPNKGAVQLFPAMASIRLEGLPAEATESADIYRALVECTAPDAVHIETTDDAGYGLDFRITLSSRSSKDIFTLYGFSAHGDTDGQTGEYHIEKSSSGALASEEFTIDSRLTSQFLNAVILQCKDSPKPESTIAAMVRQLADMSAVSEVESIGHYSIEDTPAPTIIHLAHRAIRTASSETLLHYSIQVEKTVPYRNQMDISFQQIQSLDFDRSDKFPYVAQLAAVLTDKSGSLSYGERDTAFNAYAQQYRSRQERFYRGLADAAGRLTDLT